MSVPDAESRRGRCAACRNSAIRGSGHRATGGDPGHSCRRSGRCVRQVCQGRSARRETRRHARRGYVRGGHGRRQQSGGGGRADHKVAELAPNARVAERVRLRGRVATTQLSEDMKKLAVGRAYAVKVEFVKHKVDKAKIRILSPQQSSGDNATGTVRGVDVMIDMPEKKYLSGTVKDGA